MHLDLPNFALYCVPEACLGEQLPFSLQSKLQALAEVSIVTEWSWTFLLGMLNCDCSVLNIEWFLEALFS